MFAGLETAVREDNRLPANLNVRDIFKTWSNQKGFPVLSVTRDYVTGNINLSQQRYLLSATASAADQTVFSIPYNFIRTNETDHNKTAADYWLTTRTASIGAATVGISADDWIIFNNRETGYYRVQYDKDNYKLIAEALNGDELSKIHIVTRAQLINDVYNFAETNRTSYEQYFDIIRYLKNETEYVPWAPTVAGLNTITRLYAASPSFNHLRVIRKFL